MEYCRLGNTGLEPSVLGFGCNRIGRHLYGERRREVEATLETAFERGVNFFDTASSYSFGDSERLLGEVFRSRRDRIILCSKAGHNPWVFLPAERWISSVANVLRQARVSSTGHRVLRRLQFSPWNYLPKFVEMAIAGSLRRLGTDYLDLFYLHNPPTTVVADGAVFEMLDRLKRRGWIRHYGVSCGQNYTTEEALASTERAGVSVLQVLSNACQIIDLEGVRPKARERGVALIGRQPYHKGRVFSDERLRPILNSRADRTPAQTALRFALQLEGIDTVLVGMRSRAHLEENLAALSAPALSADEMILLHSLATKK